MLEAVQLHTRAENGRLVIDLPAGNKALANSAFLVLLLPETEVAAAPAATEAPRFPPTDWAALEAAAAVAVNPYRDIKDPVQWQRELRDE